MSNYNTIVPHYSVIFADSLAKVIQGYYNFKSKISMELLSSAINDIYRVDSKEGKYILRVRRSDRFWPFTKETYQFELDLLNDLRKREFPISYPIPTKDHSFQGIINAAEGIRYFSMFTYAEGEQAEKTNLEQIRILGETIAKFHEATNDYSSNLKPMIWDLDILIDYSINKLKQFIKPEVTSEVNGIEQVAKKLVNIHNHMLNEKMRPSWGIIHGSYDFKHVYFKKNNPQVFDLEFCGYGWRIFDLVFIVNQLNYKDMNDKYVQTFLRGYQSVRKLSKSEIDAIPIMAKLALIAKLASNAGMYYLVGSLWFDNKIKSDLKLIKMALDTLIDF